MPELVAKMLFKILKATELYSDIELYQVQGFLDDEIGEPFKKAVQLMDWGQCAYLVSRYAIEVSRYSTTESKPPEASLVVLSKPDGSFRTPSGVRFEVTMRRFDDANVTPGAALDMIKSWIDVVDNMSNLGVTVVTPQQIARGDPQQPATQPNRASTIRTIGPADNAERQQKQATQTVVRQVDDLVTDLLPSGENTYETPVGLMSMGQIKSVKVFAMRYMQVERMNKIDGSKFVSDELILTGEGDLKLRIFGLKRIETFLDGADISANLAENIGADMQINPPVLVDVRIRPSKSNPAVPEFDQRTDLAYVEYVGVTGA